MSVLIKNGHIFTAVDNYVADILVDDGKIRTIGIDLSADDAKTIDATGKYVIPGGIDPHTHLDFPFGGTVSSDDFSTGTIAAAVGGTTTIVDFVVQQPGQSLTEALEIWHRKAGGQAEVDYGFHMIIRDLPDSRLPEMDEMVRQGVTSFKMFMAYRGAVMVDDDTIFKAMVRAADNGAMICLHAEHGHMIDVLVQEALAKGDTAPRFHASTRPPITEAEATDGFGRRLQQFVSATDQGCMGPRFCNRPEQVITQKRRYHQNGAVFKAGEVRCTASHAEWKESPELQSIRRGPIDPPQLIGHLINDCLLVI